MLIKTIIIIFMLIILFCLGSGVIYLISSKGDDKRLVKALTWRIGLSITLFLILFLAFALGWIKPHGI